MKENSIAKINKICLAVNKLKPEDFKAIKEVSQKQIEYIHPLRMGYANKIHRLGEQNIMVIDALQKLQEAIKSAKQSKS